MAYLKIRQIQRIFFQFLSFCILTASISTVSADQAPKTTITKLSTQEIETLVAPVALYPDDLLAQVLAASTTPLTIVKAARYQRENEDATKPPQEAMELWEPSVVSLMMFPNVLKMMSDYLDWTERLGATMTLQEVDIYEAVQQLRHRADGAGNLTNNDKQLVVIENDVIKIEPANPEIVYVPVYDPEIIYVPSSTLIASETYPYITYGRGVRVGVSFSYAFDWERRHVIHHYHWNDPNHHRNYNYRSRSPIDPGQPIRAWRPPPPRPEYGPRPPRPPIPRPQMTGTHPPPAYRSNFPGPGSSATRPQGQKPQRQEGEYRHQQTGSKKAQRGIYSEGNDYNPGKRKGGDKMVPKPPWPRHSN